jgi:CTP-dependent riboflavin kinase
MHKKTKMKTQEPKGVSIIKKMMEDKKAIHEHIVKGGKLVDLKEKYNFVKPISIAGK